MRWPIAALALVLAGCAAPEPAYRNAKLSAAARVDDLLEHRNDPAVRDALSFHVSDGPDSTPLAATWDTELAGAAARPATALDVSQLGDDAWLASRMTVAWVGALQGDGFIATLKGSPQEGESETPFRAAVEEAGLWSVDAPEQSELLLESWGFKGFDIALPTTDDQVRRRALAAIAIGTFDADRHTTRRSPDINDESIVLLKNSGGLLPVSNATVVFSDDPITILKAAKAAKNIVVVIDKAGLSRAGEWLDQVPAVIEAWGSKDVDRVLTGQVNPSGRMPFATPSFPFGFGLSYTTFNYSDLKIFPATPRYGQLVTATVRVTNSGSRPGAEVIQLYVNGKLKGFRRAPLKPGESRLISFEIDHRAMSFYDPLVRDWATKPGIFQVKVGPLSGSFELFR